MIRFDLEDTKFVFSTDITIDNIKEYFKTYNNKGPFFSMFETGINNLRFDLIRINAFQRNIRIFEFKSCRQDFVSDKKWHKYLRYCHTFTFVCARNVIKKEDLPPGIGLLWVFKWQHNNDYQKNQTWKLSAEWIKKPRKRLVAQTDLLDIAFILVNRVKYRENDVF